MKTDKNIKALIESSNNLKQIVEGAHSVRWNYEGFRLRDTPQWCKFYVALSKLNREVDKQNKP